MREVRTLLLGGCLLHGPMNYQSKDRSRKIVNARVASGGSVPGTYTLGEKIQVMRLLKGEIELTAGVRCLAGFAPGFTPLSGTATLENVDVVLLEPASPWEMLFEGGHVNRACILRLINPLKPISREIAKLANAWFNKGVMAMDAKFQQEAASKLITVFPDDLPDPDLLKRVLLTLRVQLGDISQGMQELLSYVNKPVGVLTFINQYMPDGRPVPWPASFREDVLAAAKEFRLPIIEPWHLVQKYGVKLALRDDLRHYREEFMPVVADTIGGFAAEVADLASEEKHEQPASAIAGD